jgi:hypothetical protein
LVGREARAKAHLVVPYAYDAVWPGAVRFVRVDRGWKILEQDKAAGFVRFALIEDKKPHTANLELVRTTDGEGREAVRLQLSSEDLATSQEAPVLSALARKLREELGAPPPPPARKKEPAPAAPQPAPDAGSSAPE